MTFQECIALERQHAELAAGEREDRMMRRPPCRCKFAGQGLEGLDRQELADTELDFRPRVRHNRAIHQGRTLVKEAQAEKSSVQGTGAPNVPSLETQKEGEPPGR